MASSLVLALFCVLKVSVTRAEEDFEYVGCYPLKHLGRRVQEPVPKLGTCADRCRQRNAAYAAYRNKQYCYCVGNLTTLSQQNDSSCTYNCVDSARSCGGSATASLYRIDPPMRVSRIIFSFVMLGLVFLVLTLTIVLWRKRNTGSEDLDHIIDYS